MKFKHVEAAQEQLRALDAEYAAMGGPRSRRHAILCRQAVALLVEAERVLDGICEREVPAPAAAPKASPKAAPKVAP